MVSIGCSQIELAPTDADEIEAGHLLPTEQMSTYDEDTCQCPSLPALYVNQNLRARDLWPDQDDASWRGLLNQLDHERRSVIRTYTVYIDIRRDDAGFSPPSGSCDSV